MSDPLELIDSYLDGTIAEGDAAALRRWLDEDPSHLATFIRLSSIHRALRSVFVGEQEAQAHLAGVGESLNASDDAEDVRPSKHDEVVARTTFRSLIRRPTPLSMAVAAMVMALVVTAMYFMAPPVYRAMTSRERTNDDPAPVIVAQLTGFHEAVWAEESLSPQEGAWLQGGQRLALTSGMAEVMFRSGATVLIEGPAQFDLLGSNTGHLAQGRVTAKVPQPAHGFTVETPNARIIDLGTEFGVQVAQEQSGVQVFEGKVEVAPKSPSTGATTKGRVLVAGQGIVIDKSGVVVLEEQPDAQAFRRDLPNAKQFVEITPELVAGQNYQRLMSNGAGRAIPDGKMNNYDAALGAAAGNQFVWFDLSSCLSQLPAEGVEKVFFRWEGVILPNAAHTGAATVQTDLGLFAVPDDERGVPSVFVRGDGKDNVNFYVAYAEEVIATVTVPAVKQNHRFLANWDITNLVQQWRDNPDAPRRGQFIIVNSQQPIWLQWEGKMPRVYAQVKPKDLRSQDTKFDSPTRTNTEQEK